MCLKTVERTAKGRSSKVLTGYKVLHKCTTGDGGGWTNLIRYGHYLTGKWYLSKSRTLETVQNKQYELGFHIYPTLEDAQKDPNLAWGTIVKVRYKGLLAQGTEYRPDYSMDMGNVTYVLRKEKERNVVVARYIKIVGEVEV